MHAVGACRRKLLRVGCTGVKAVFGKRLQSGEEAAVSMRDVFFKTNTGCLRSARSP